MTLAQLRAQFNPEKNDGPREGFNNWYPFWNMKEGERVVLRFLPDKNEENKYGFVFHKLEHELVIGGEKKKVPCLKMWDEDCPICKVSREYYKVDDKVNGKRFYVKKTFVVQALIVEDPLPPDAKTGETHKGQLRLVSLGQQIYQIIQDAFKSDDELEAIPYDLQDGYDFIIKKSKQGEYASYAIGTKFGKQRTLTEAEIGIYEDKGVDLISVRPKHPGLDRVTGMLDAALTGSAYDVGGDSSAKNQSDQFESKPAAAASTATSGDDDVDAIMRQLRGE